MNRAAIIIKCSLTLIALLLILSAGCIGDNTKTQTVTNATLNTTTAESSSSLSDTADKPVSRAVPVEVLAQYLPPSGSWEAGTLDGEAAKDGTIYWSWASKLYENQMSDAVASVTIQDTCGEYIGHRDGWDDYYDFQFPDFSMRSGKVAGYPTWYMIDTPNKEYTQIVCVEDRFFVSVDIAKGYENYFTVFNTMIDYPGIAALADEYPLV